MLKPGQLAHWNKRNKAIQLYEVNPDVYFTWINGYLSFNRDRLQKIVRILNRYYNVSIKIENDAFKENKVTGKLDLNDDIETTLKNLGLASKLTINKLKKNEYIIE
ncbi:DUF4974 domain-containing protein [Algibacter miyuki]|uniref:DUF4974 domain-containing protein n=1 Tax=Algibacter miyuki TaxID=1306933 RepID=UPI0025B52059|nr:DUF4974 domain-containing protein [Algibacter miyuki]MDN3667640.1 DUF4974 domain-containing protein [Algibacter miyuki]